MCPSHGVLSHCLYHRNELERVYLEQLQFNINVASSTYAQYYFDLRSLAEDNGLSFPNEYETLTKERAKQLEVGLLECVSTFDPL